MSKRPSTAEMRDMFYEIVNYAKQQGCPVKVHKSKSKVNGSNGYFCPDPSPHIEVGLKGKPWPKAIELVIHEFCHYWQWRDNFLEHKDDEGNILYARMLDGETLTPRERKKAGVLIRLSEYDCEIRTASLFEKWNLESIFPPEEHIKSANTYNRHIAWSVGDDRNKGSAIFLATYDQLASQLWGDKVFSHFWNPKTPEGLKKILAPISRQHKKIFDEALKESKGVAARRLF